MKSLKIRKDLKICSRLYRFSAWVVGVEKERQWTLAIQLCDVTAVNHEILFFSSSLTKDSDVGGRGN